MAKKFERKRPAKTENKPAKKFKRIPIKKELSNMDRISTKGPEFCFVCGKLLKKKQKKILVWGKGENSLWRHARCDCHSAAWKRKFKPV
jgi:hypothetical protein